MLEMDAQGNSVLMKELKESFLSGGHTLSEWHQLVERPDLPEWSLWWITVQDDDQARRLQQALGVFAGPRTLLEIEVRDDSGETTGRAMVGIKEVKMNAGHYTAKVTHLASTNEEFADWGQLHFNELQDFELHFCKKVAHTCTQRSKSKTIGWFHVSCFRLISMLTAINHEYVAEAAIQYFSTTLQEYMEDAAWVKAQDATRGAAPAKKEKKTKAKTKAAGCSASNDETKKKRAEQKKEVLRLPGGRDEVGFAPGGGSGPSRAPKGSRLASPGVDRAEAARLARESAEAATRALGTSGPQLVDRVRLTARKEDVPGGGQRGYGDGNQGRVHSFLDDIPEGSIDGLALSEGKGERGARGRSRSQRRGKEPRHVEKDKKKKKKDKGSEKSSSPGRREHNLRGRNVIAPAKDTKKGARKEKGDPSSDPDSSSPGGGKKGKKKRKRSSSSSMDSKKKHEKKKRRKREKKKKKDKKSSSSSTADSQEDLYGKETAKYESLVEKSRRNPGRLLRSGLEQMSKYLAARTGGEGGPTVSWRDQRVGAYLNQVLFNQHPPSVIGVRNTRELVTLAEAIDLLMEEQLPSLGDLLMQRLKAVEASLTEGWSVASYQELIPPSRATLTTDQERAFAARHALQQRRLSDAVKKKSG